jgi:hypothetical protein
VPATTETTDAARVAKASLPAASTKGAASAPAVPAGSAGLAEKPQGILLRFNADPDKRQWERLTDAAPLVRGDRLLCLAPFRSSIILGTLRITLVGETEVRVLSQASDPVPALELAFGRLLVRQPASGSLNVSFSDRVASLLEMAPEDAVALERMDVRSYGQPIERPLSLAVISVQGDLTLSIDQKQQSLKAGSMAVIDRGGQVATSTPDTLPAWATQPEAPSAEVALQEQFLQLFQPGRPVLAEIVVATEDDRPEIRRLAISALKALGDLSFLMPLLSREGDRISRRSAMEAIRSYMALGPDASRRVREQLDLEFGENLGQLAHHMLTGYTTEEAAKRDVYPGLVGLLAPDQPKVGLRELALDTLKRLKGRDDLGYDPDHPGGKGLEAWTELLRPGEARPSGPRAKAK